MRERLRTDRLLRWTVVAQLPVLWLAVALADPAVLLLGPAAAAVVAVLFRYGPLERHEPEDELL